MKVRNKTQFMRFSPIQGKIKLVGYKKASRQCLSAVPCISVLLEYVPSVIRLSVNLPTGSVARREKFGRRIRGGRKITSRLFLTLT